MKRYASVMSMLVLCGPMAVQAEDAVPKRADFARYEGMLKRSPFAIATAPALVAQAPSWAKDLYVANAAHAPEVDLVTLMSVSDRNLKEYLTTAKPNDHGYGIANIEWSETPGATKVTISKDGQFATIGFNEALASQPNVDLPPSPINSAPGIQQNLQNPQLPPLPVPHTRGVIQRNPMLPAPPGAVPVQPAPARVPARPRPPSKSQLN
ncbi:MAG: hypothetical protein ACREIW_13125 [Chthoniobacterales bacterium]